MRRLLSTSWTGHAKRAVFATTMILFTTIDAGWTGAEPPAFPQLKSVSLAGFQVTEGTIEELPNGHLSVSSSKMRAVVPSSTSPTAEVRFKYLGPMARASTLGSGEIRRQLGLKLRAQDPCNLLYVMWRLEPKPGIVVSIKLNPGQHSSSECENGGYHNIKPLHAAPVPELVPGVSHSLRAEMKKDDLAVMVDDRVVWEGPVGNQALRLEGPVGLRTDNSRVEFQFFVESGKPR
jgi:hypothetical protein